MWIVAVRGSWKMKPADSVVGSEDSNFSAVSACRSQTFVVLR
jgi:hypothetical protein